MAGILLNTGNESVTLPVSVVAALEQRGDGDAALLYLALLRHQGTVPPRSLAGELRWERERIERAESVLRELQLIAGAEQAPPEPPPAAPPAERPEYTPRDVVSRLEENEDFRGLTGAVERRLGKRLTTADLHILLGLYDYLGLPSDVIYLLVCHCAQRTARRLGSGRRPGMREIEKEGYAWARMGINTQAEAAGYLERYARRQSTLPRYMRVLRLPERSPSPSEEKYLLAWQEMGFPPESVAIAYDKTILRCGELKWPYLNGILKKWHAAALHTPEEIASGDRPAAGGKQDEPGTGDLDWMQQYVRPGARRKEV